MMGYIRELSQVSIYCPGIGSIFDMSTRLRHSLQPTCTDINTFHTESIYSIEHSQYFVDL